MVLDHTVRITGRTMQPQRRVRPVVMFLGVVFVAASLVDGRPNGNFTYPCMGQDVACVGGDGRPSNCCPNFICVKEDLDGAAPGRCVYFHDVLPKPGQT
ncbi:hypothetical protein ONE63_008067 [Megalurothrips usitatus]|uniref:Uncharacterized protein n=1 Tax=Megalurothrips usitatus TaxID=439358 RepID=A0AAV7XPN9_9NEOP|nr:hypothetical protein ONE63_008067 [Megalurothrips usitatus]